MNQNLETKIYNSFLEKYGCFNNPHYIIRVYKSSDRLTTNNVDVYNIEINEHDIYSYSFNGKDYQEVDEIRHLGFFYARVTNNEILSIHKDYLY